MADARKPVRFANYPGDCTAEILDDSTVWADYQAAMGPLKGPNLLGENVYAVTAEYDAEADTTRVGFVLATVPDLERIQARYIGS